MFRFAQSFQTIYYDPDALVELCQLRFGAALHAALKRHQSAVGVNAALL